MIRPFSVIERRIVAVLLLLALAAALVAAVAIPVRMAHVRYDNALLDARDRFARYARVAASRADVEKTIAAVRAKDAGRFYLKSSTPALAAADIQQVIQTLVEANGLVADNLTIAPHKDDGAYRRITVSLRLRGKLNGLQHLLYSIESAQPYLFIDNLNIQTSVRQNYIPQPGTEPDVTASVEVSGYAMKRPSNVQARR